MNLLSNAIKFQAAGTIVVELIVEQSGPSESEVVVYVFVTDKGIGMTKEECKNVFKPNWRSQNESSLKLNHQGNGLGLYICMQICNGLGGGIRVHSEVGQGTTFAF